MTNNKPIEIEFSRFPLEPEEAFIYAITGRDGRTRYGVIRGSYGAECVNYPRTATGETYDIVDISPFLPPDELDRWIEERAKELPRPLEGEYTNRSLNQRLALALNGE